MSQCTNRVLMIKPIAFDYNEETAVDNKYQNKSDIPKGEIQKKALEEFENLAKTLKDEGIEVNIFEDTEEPKTPDSIFPNNWFSTHYGTLNIYPMFASNRRDEISKFKDKLIDLYKPEKVNDYQSFENEGEFLEGTGAMVLDRVRKISYCTLSKRASLELLNKVCSDIDYESEHFKSSQHGSPIYHTNVLMSITTDFAIICPELVEEKYRGALLNDLCLNHELVALTPEQIDNYAGNCLELDGQNGRFLIMSKTGFDSLTKEQREQIEARLPIKSVDVSTIEKYGGGSVRCMIGELF